MTAAWTVVMRSGKGHLPSGRYQGNVHKSPAFKQRLEFLMSEKAAADAGDDWDQLKRQMKQAYRWAVAINDPEKMLRANDAMHKLLKDIDRRNGPPPVANDESEEKRGRGAPTAPTPLAEDTSSDFFAERLVSR